MIVDSPSAQEPRFERLRLIGEGASARVDLARLVEPFGDLPAESLVAVKAPCDGADAEDWVTEAFRAEAEASARARHPSLAHVLHLGEADGAPYLLLVYVPGRSLREILTEEGALPEPLVRSVGAQLAGALAALHAADLVHGDVKPENVRLDDEGRAVLLDLGFARRIQEAERHADAGSLPYLSPERARGGPPTAAADVFALGVVLFELATGVHPYGRTSQEQGTTHPGDVVGYGSTSVALLRRSIEISGADDLLAAIATCRFVPPSHLNPLLSPFLDQLLETVQRRTPGGRPAAEALARRLSEGESGDWWRARVDPRKRATAPPRTGAHLTALVGREAELDELFACLAGTRRDAAAGRPDGRIAVAWLGGPEGCGKWRLGREFAARARASDDPPIHLYARWSERVEARPAGALLILLHRWLRLPPGAEPGARERSALEELAGRRTANTLLTALSPAEPEPSATPESVPAALAHWLTALGRKRPVLLFLDDLQRAGSVTLDALSAVLDALEDSQILLLLGVREDVPAADPGLERLRAHLLAEDAERPFTVRRIALAPLGRDAVRTIVTELFDRGAPRMRLAEVLWKRSAGNPGQITEILYDLIERGDARPIEGRAGETKLRLTIAPDELPMPRSLDRIIAERFAAVEPSDRRWLARLAVVGGYIEPNYLVRAFPPTGRAEADHMLARLVHSGWLAPAADRYRFARPALREAVYRAIGESRRRRLHLAAAHALVPESGEATAEEIFQRAFHLRAAHEHGELLELTLHLLRTHGRRISPQRLLTVAQWGLEALEELPPPSHRGATGASFDEERQRLELLEAGVDAADRVGRRGEQRELLDSLTDLDLDAEEHPAEAARLYLLHGRHAASTGHLGLARGLLRNASELAQASGDRGLESEAFRRLAQVQAQIGELGAARRLAENALETAASGPQRAFAHLALAHLDILDDRVEDGLDGVDAALVALRGAREPHLEVVAYANLLRARIWRSGGEPRRAIQAVQRAIRLARRSGERQLEAEARARFGGLLLDLDRPDEAEAQLHEAQLTADEIEDRRGQVLARLWLGLLLWEEDDDRARSMIERGIALGEEIGFYRAVSFGLAILARVRREAGDPEGADAASARAVALLARHGAELADSIAILGTRVLVLRSAGRDGEARKVQRDLERRMERSRRNIRDPELRRDQRDYGKRLLAAVLSPEGPIYPRTP